MFGLQWKNEISIGDVLTIIGFLLTFVGLLFAGWQFLRQTAVDRARFLLELAKGHLVEESVRKLYYKIDQEDWVYDESKFHGSDDERNLDTMLYHFDLIGRMVKSNMLTPAEAQFFSYEAHRVLHNPEVKKYLEWLDKNLQVGGRPHRHFPEARYLADLLSSNSSR